MDTKFSNKILSLTFVIALLFPMGISFTHAFDKHQFKNCDNQLQFHTHKNETNCHNYHYSPNQFTLDNSHLFSLLIPKKNHQEIYSLNALFVPNLLSSIQLRAPPVL